MAYPRSNGHPIAAVAHRAVLLHLDHERPYRDAAVASRQRALRHEVKRSGRTRALRGLDEVRTPWTDQSPALTETR